MVQKMVKEKNSSKSGKSQGISFLQSGKIDILKKGQGKLKYH